MSKYGVNVPKGVVASTPDEAVAAAKEVVSTDGEVRGKDEGALYCVEGGEGKR